MQFTSHTIKLLILLKPTHTKSGIHPQYIAKYREVLTHLFQYAAICRQRNNIICVQLISRFAHPPIGRMPSFPPATQKRQSTCVKLLYHLHVYITYSNRMRRWKTICLGDPRGDSDINSQYIIPSTFLPVMTAAKELF